MNIKMDSLVIIASAYSCRAVVDLAVVQHHNDISKSLPSKPRNSNLHEISLPTQQKIKLRSFPTCFQIMGCKNETDLEQVIELLTTLSIIPPYCLRKVECKLVCASARYSLPPLLDAEFRSFLKLRDQLIS